MKALVLDGSAALGLILPDERYSAISNRVRQALAADIVIHVPAHWWIELTNGILMAERRKRISQAVVAGLLELMEELGVSTDAKAAAATSAVMSLARQETLTAYDAAYLELAIRLGAGIASQDKQLLAAARNCGVEVLA